MIPIAEPQLGDEEKQAVLEVLESGILSQGPKVKEFEQEFAEYLGIKHAIAVSNGTVALHAALLAHDITYHDEVITTPYTFIASINSIIYTGATPVFVDIDDTFNLDVSQLEKVVTARTKAILPVHLYGSPVNMDRITEFANEHGLIIIEDAAQAHGAKFKNQKVGTFGTGCFSFYATKNMTTGEGGMIVTNDDDIAAKLRRIVNHGSEQRYFHTELGYNYRMPEIAAAMGIEQLKKLSGFNYKRRVTAATYTVAFYGIPGLILPYESPSTKHVYHQYTLRITDRTKVTRNHLQRELHTREISTGIYYPVPAYRQTQNKVIIPQPVADEMSFEVLSLPVHPGLSREDVVHIIDSVQDIML